MPMIEVNNPATLERARIHIRAIASAKNELQMKFQWAWAGGYFLALANEKLIDKETLGVLGDEADCARSGYQASRRAIDELTAQAQEL